MDCNVTREKEVSLSNYRSLIKLVLIQKIISWFNFFMLAEKIKLKLNSATSGISLCVISSSFFLICSYEMTIPADSG